MKYNSVENAERFIEDQIKWVRENGYENFTIWSNGTELSAKLDTEDIYSKFSDIDLEREGFWKAMIFRNGRRVEF